jgi:hypothetical protein
MSLEAWILVLGGLDPEAVVAAAWSFERAPKPTYTEKA